MSNDRNIFLFFSPSLLILFSRYTSLQENMKVLLLYFCFFANSPRLDSNQTCTMELREENAIGGCNSAANLCRHSVNDISQFRLVSFIIDRQCIAFAADISTTRVNFPAIFSERIVQHFSATIRTRYLYTFASRRSA